MSTSIQIQKINANTEIEKKNHKIHQVNSFIYHRVPNKII
jgi:hypothetical protein